MDEKENSRRKSHQPFARRMVQLYAALLYNAHVRGFVEGNIYTGTAKYACVPGLNCYSCPGAVGACPLGALQNALASSGHRAGFYVLGILLLYGVILGRTICGWLCPMGLVQELLYKIPTFKLRKNSVTRVLSRLKYLILAVFVVALPLGYGLKYDLPLPAFCKYICPAGTFEGAVDLLSNPVNEDKFGLLGFLFTGKLTIMVAVGLACVFCFRSFCRFLCPLGAVFGLFNRLNLIGVKVDEGRCNHCGACVRGCPMDVRRVGDHECISCGTCIESCSRRAITLRAGTVILKASGTGADENTPGSAQRQQRRAFRIVQGMALAGLCFALVWFNLLDPAVRSRAASGRADSAQISSAQTDYLQETGAQTEAEPEVRAQTEAEPETGAKAETEPETGAKAEAEPETGVQSDIESKTDVQDAPAQAASAEDADFAKQEENQTAHFASDAPVGSEVGMQLEDFSIECFDGNTFHLKDSLGKVTFINLWATYCAPCVRELDDFDELYQAHPDDIAMIAVHSALVTDDPAAYARDKGWTMPLAVDTPDSLVWNIVGGSSTLPQTIVLNRRGEVIYNETRSITPRMLQELYERGDE